MALQTQQEGARTASPGGSGGTVNLTNNRIIHPSACCGCRWQVGVRNRWPEPLSDLDRWGRGWRRG